MKLKVVTRTVSAVISGSFSITEDVKALPVNHNRFTGFALLVSSFKLLFNFPESLFLALRCYNPKISRHDSSYKSYIQ